MRSAVLSILLALLGPLSYAADNPDPYGQQTMANSRPVAIASDQAPVPASQSGVWTTGRTWSLLNTTDSVNAVQSGAWTTGRTWSLLNTTDSVNAVQSGTWTVQQGTPPWTVSGTASVGSPPTAPPLSVSGVDGSGFKRHFLLDTDGTQLSDLMRIGGSIYTLGQKIMAGGAPVTIASDQTGINSFLDKASSGTITALNGTVTLATNGMGVVSLSISGTWVATLEFEGSNDGGSTYPFIITGVTVPGGTAQTSTTINGQWSISASGYTHVRVKATAFTSGTASLLMNAGAGNIDLVAFTNFVTQVSGTNSFRNIAGATTVTVKSGSGVLHTLCINNLNNGTYTLYDNTAASGTKIATITGNSNTAINCSAYDVQFSTGLTVTTTNASTDLTVTYR